MISHLVLTAMLTLHASHVGVSCYAYAHGLGEKNPLFPASCATIAVSAGATDAALIAITQRHVKTPWKRAAIYGLVAGSATAIMVRDVRYTRHALQARQR